jgi:hypothetical protein
MEGRTTSVVLRPRDDEALQRLRAANGHASMGAIIRTLIQDADRRLTDDVEDGVVKRERVPA